MKEHQNFVNINFVKKIKEHENFRNKKIKLN